MGVVNKEKGLRETPYMKSDELIQWMKLACLCGELEACAKATVKGKWRAWMKCAYGLIWKVVLERMSLVEPKAMKSIMRRKEHSKIKMITSDEERFPSRKETQEFVTVAYDDLLDLADLAMNSCAACPQGECVKDCFYKKVLLRLALPVCRDNPAEGECPYNWRKVGDVEQIKPQNQRNEHYFDEDYTL